MRTTTTQKLSIRTLLVLLAAIGLLAACGGSGDTDSGSVADAPTPAADSPRQTPVADAAPRGTSAVTGTVVFEGQPPQLKPISMNADPACAAKHDGPVMARVLELGDGQTLGNVFVQVTNPPTGTYPTPSDAAVIDQVGCLYRPRVLGVLAGQTLQFRNSDGILHNVHGLPERNREFNLGMPPTVTETTTTLKRPEPVFPIKCDVHPWMRSYVAVMEHPYFAVTDTSGEFHIEGLPAGTYTVEAWHERLGTRTATVTVGDGETAEADFTFARES